MFSAAELEAWATRLVTRAPGKAAQTATARLAEGDAEHTAMGEALHAALDAVVRCRRCGRRLKDPVSVEARVGPECRSKAVAA